MSSNFWREKNLERAQFFYDEVKAGEGWDAVKCYCTQDATFRGQGGVFHPPAASVPHLGGTLKNYMNWTKMLYCDVMPGCYFTEVSKAYDAETNTVLFSGVFHGTHSKTPEGSNLPPPTNKTTTSDYVYSIHFNADGMIDKLVKIWNSEWAAKDLGWA